MKNKIYTLIEEDCFYGEQHFNVELFDTLEKARECLKEMKEKFYKEYSDNMKDRTIDANTEDEFDCYLNGWYFSDRYVLYIVEKEIN